MSKKDDVLHDSLPIYSIFIQQPYLVQTLDAQVKHDQGVDGFEGLANLVGDGRGARRLHLVQPGDGEDEGMRVP